MHKMLQHRVLVTANSDVQRIIIFSFLVCVFLCVTVTSIVLQRDVNKQTCGISLFLLIYNFALSCT